MPTNLQASVARLSAALLFTLFAVSAAIAQSDLTSEADALFERRGYFEAAKEYQAVGAKIKSDLTLAGYCFYQAGEAFRLYHKPKDAIENYQKALGLKYGSRENKLFLMYGDCLRDIEEFEDAIDMYEKYKGAGGDARVADERIDKTNDALDYLDEQASRYIVEPMVLLNKPQYDLSPTFTGKDQDEMVFASSRPSAQGSEEDPITGESTMDLFYTELDKKGTRWSEPTPLGNTICTDDNEGAACFSSDGKTLYFTRCVNMDGSNLACDLYMAKKQGSRFGASMPLEIINRDVNDSSQVGHPALTPDDQYLIFASDLPGGEGGKTCGTSKPTTVLLLERHPSIWALASILRGMKCSPMSGTMAICIGLPMAERGWVVWTYGLQRFVRVKWLGGSLKHFPIQSIRSQTISELLIRKEWRAECSLPIVPAERGPMISIRSICLKWW